MDHLRLILRRSWDDSFTLFFAAPIWTVITAVVVWVLTLRLQWKGLGAMIAALPPGFVWTVFAPVIVFVGIFLFHCGYLTPKRLMAETAKERDVALEKLAVWEQTGLKGRIITRIYFDDDKGRSGIAVALQITNIGNPTIVDGWGLTFELDNTQVGFPARHGDFNIPDDSGGVIALKADDMLYEKVGTQPIANGGRVSGFLVFVTKNISYARLLSERPTITVLFRDAHGRECTVEQRDAGWTTQPFHEPGLVDPFAAILLRQAKDAEAGKQLYYQVVKRIGNGERPIMVLIEMGIADQLNTNGDVVRFCTQLVADNHGDPFEHLRVIYPPEVWREFLQEARRKNLKFLDAVSEVDYIHNRFIEHEEKLKQTT
jgi:hypothetical protein